MKKGPIVTLAIALLLGGVAERAQVPGDAKQAAVGFSCLSKIEADDWKTLLADVRRSNPLAADRLASDATMRQRQTDSLRQLLAFCSQAVKDGLAGEPRNAHEVKSIRREVTAINYDKLKNPKPDHERFSTINAGQITTFYSAKTAEGEFEQFMKDKLSLIKGSDPSAADHVVTAAERKEARDAFAKMNISEAAYLREAASLSLDFKRTVELQIALQQAQFLARLYSEKVADQIGVTDAEIEAYVSKHTELRGKKSMKDPEDPTGPAIPVAEFVRKTLEREKENAITAKVLIENPIAIVAIPLSAASKPAAKTDH